MPTARFLATLSLVATFGSCAAVPEPLPGPPVLAPSAATATATATASAQAPALAPPLPLPPAIDAAASVVCSYQATSEKAPRIALFLPGGEKKFATVSGGTYRLDLPPTDLGNPVVDVETAGLRGRAQARLSSLNFYQKTPLVFGGFLAPDGSTTVQASRVSTEGLAMQITPPVSRLTIRSARLAAQAACGDLRLEPASIDGSTLIPDTAKARPATLREGRTFPLRTGEKGEPAAELTTRRRPSKPSLFGVQPAVPVSVVKTSGSLSLIVARVSGATMFGWVPSAEIERVRSPKLLSSGMLGLLGGAESPPEASKYERIICDRELPLVVEHEGQRATLGVVNPGVCMELHEQGPELAWVALHGSRIETEEKVKLLVPAGALASCRRIKAGDAAATPASCSGAASDVSPGSLWGADIGDFGLGGLGLRPDAKGEGTGGLGTGTPPAEKPTK